MRSSTVRREKLLSPLHVAAIVLLFVVAFVVLAPGERVFQVATENGGNGPVVVDPLAVAYLKARQSTEQQPTEEVARTMTALIRQGRLDEAKELLLVYPDLTLNTTDRYRLDLELAAGEWTTARSGASEPKLTATRQHLRHLLSLPLVQPELRTSDVLKRGFTLSEPLNEPLLRHDYYQALSKLPAEEESNWLHRCGTEMAASGIHREAIACFERYLALKEPEPGSVQLALLALYYQVDDRLAIDEMQRSLSANDKLSATELESFARLLLEHNRPDLAHGVFAQLAVVQPGKQRSWLDKAARWAEAANQPAVAAAYLQRTLSGQSRQDLADIEARLHRLLLAAGNQELALARLQESVALYPDDVDVLRRAIPIARRLGNSGLATRWNERILYQYPEDDEALRLQIELTLAEGDVGSAQQWAERLIDQNPDDLEARQSLARISEWSGDPWTAIEHWNRVLQQDTRRDVVEQVTRLANSTWQPHFAATALRRLGREQPLDKHQIKELVSAYELEGRPDEAAAALRDLRSAHGASIALLRELAQLHYRHKNYRQSLHAWKQVRDFGDHSSSTYLALTELHWRLNEPEQAVIAARKLTGDSLFTNASAYQIRLVSELAWRYQIPELGLLVQPGLVLLEDEDQRRAELQRLIASFKASGQRQVALQESLRLWKTTEDAEYGVMAMTLAAENRDDKVVEQFLVDTPVNRKLHLRADYWVLFADARLKRADYMAAEAAYHRAIKLDPPNEQALTGLLWMHIGTGDREALALLLAEYQQKLEQSPALWPPAAVAYLSLGETALSVQWFERARDAINSDYGLLLTYADALEFSGRAHDALALRTHALRSLRPLLEEGSRQDRDMLLQQYVRAVEQYQSSNEVAQSAIALLRERGANGNGFWREDMAIAWLMATQQHEHARLVMTQLHQQRLSAPRWQSLALAMKADDVNTVSEILRSGDGIAVGDQILALRQLGRDSDAWQLAKTTVVQPRSGFDRATAKTQYLQMRTRRPSYAGAQLSSLSIRGLSAQESGVDLRHTLSGGEYGFGLDLKKRRYRSDILNLTGREEETDAAISLFAGDRLQSWRVTAGFLSDELSDETYAQVAYERRNRRDTRGFQTEFAYREQVEGAPELRLAALQDRATVSVDSNFGSREFVRLQADVTRLSSRVQDNLISRGLRTSAEVGIRGALGAHTWISSLQVQNTRNEREDFPPPELLLQDDAGIDSVLVARASSVALGFSIQRGSAAPLESRTSPHYFLQANIGHYWPEETFALKLNAGAGIRVLGGDELGFNVFHDSSPVSGDSPDETRVGVNYRYHF
ncbi:MAG: tetratricopeptide repeat protein [Gammaproteobacteria bacterium]|nr:tetratricopeptide repeat protein [Gammaproteobacteria bacterium]